jgi:hypothetical protein
MAFSALFMLGTGDIVGLILVYSYVALVVVISVYAKKKYPGCGYRKIVHILVGNIVFLWWIFDSRYVIALLAAAPFIPLLLLVTPSSPLRRLDNSFLKLATAHLKEKQPREMKTSTLLHITHSSMEPDFYSVRVPEENWTWFIFPWNLHEDMRTLLPKTLTEPRDDAAICRAFKTQFKIGVPPTLVHSTLKELKAAGKIAKTTKGWTAAEKH